jgi:hypothetical protein
MTVIMSPPVVDFRPL